MPFCSLRLLLQVSQNLCFTDGMWTGISDSRACCNVSSAFLFWPLNLGSHGRLNLYSEELFWNHVQISWKSTCSWALVQICQKTPWLCFLLCSVSAAAPERLQGWLRDREFQLYPLDLLCTVIFSLLSRCEVLSLKMAEIFQAGVLPCYCLILWWVEQCWSSGLGPLLFRRDSGYETFINSFFLWLFERFVEFFNRAS